MRSCRIGYRSDYLSSVIPDSHHHHFRPSNFHTEPRTGTATPAIDHFTRRNGTPHHPLTRHAPCLRSSNTASGPSCTARFRIPAPSQSRHRRTNIRRVRPDASISIPFQEQRPKSDDEGSKFRELHVQEGRYQQSDFSILCGWDHGLVSCCWGEEYSARYGICGH